ncbi:protein phosphatase 2C domain-containing protein [Streptomyces sp. NPDC127177]|uniref:protein phosphatase 2C domain-containing protein n=1 Tax=Streptomyces sp. NPDC127177 TaxID=3345384 RepID=UPI003633E625
MSQQGERPAAHEDDWWRRLYDESAPDTGASQAADSLDDRFDSVSGAVGAGDREAYGAPTAVPEPRVAPPVAARPVQAPPGPPLPPPPREPVRAPWEPPTGTPRPRTFEAPPPEPEPERAPEPSQAPAPESEPVPEPARAAPLPAPVPEPAPAAVPQPPPPADPRVAQSLLSGGRVGEPSAPEPQARVSSPAAAAADPAPPLPRRPVVERTADERPDPAVRAAPEPPAAEAAAHRPPVAHVGDRPPTYDAEPTALPATDPREIHALVADTVLDGASYGTYTLRAASVRGDSARFRGEPRRDALLTVRFGTAENALVLVAVAGGARTAEGVHPAAADACRWIGEAVGRSHARLSEDIRAGRRADLKSGLHRLADRSYGKLRARAAELGLEPHEYTAGLRCLLLSADPDCRTRVFFGVGGGGLFRLRDGSWQDIEPAVPHTGEVTGEGVVGYGSASPGDAPESGPDGERLTMDLGITTAPSPYVEGPVPPPAEPFRFRASVARPGDTLLLCSSGLADPLRGEPALADELAERWAPGPAPGLAAFLADTQLRVKGYADDRTAVGVWEA